MRAQPSLTPMRRGRLPAFRCRHPEVDGLERPSGRNATPSGNTPSTIMSPAGRTARSRTEISPGARAHHRHRLNRAHGPPPTAAAFTETTTISRLTRAPDTDKRKRLRGPRAVARWGRRMDSLLLETAISLLLPVGILVLSALAGWGNPQRKVAYWLLAAGFVVLVGSFAWAAFGPGPPRDANIGAGLLGYVGLVLIAFAAGSVLQDRRQRGSRRLPL